MATSRRQATRGKRQKGWAIADGSLRPFLWSVRNGENQAISEFCRNYHITRAQFADRGYHAVQVTLREGWK
jgi:hypothetical protein